MRVIERIAAVLVLTGCVGFVGTSQILATSKAHGPITAATPLTANLPIATILIMQDAQLVAREHARLTGP
jgi:hypothetical protein